MDKCINFYEFLRYVFDDEKAIRQGAEIVKALLEAQSPRLSNISEKMPGKGESNYKAIQRFLKKVDMKRLLLRFYQEDAEFMIGDPTEMERYKAPHTAYVGTLSDGKTAGYWLMVLSTPFRGAVTAVFVCGLLFEDAWGAGDFSQPGTLSQLWASQRTIR